jgi:hypothetical protein
MKLDGMSDRVRKPPDNSQKNNPDSKHRTDLHIKYKFTVFSTAHKPAAFLRVVNEGFSSSKPFKVSDPGAG